MYSRFVYLNFAYCFALAAQAFLGVAYAVPRSSEGIDNKKSNLILSQVEKGQKVDSQIRISQDSNIAQNPFSSKEKDSSNEPRVLVTEVVIEGLDGHPDKERLEFAAYDAMSVRPGGSVTRKQLKLELDSIYSTGWFSEVKIEPIKGSLGVQLLVEVQPNPVLQKIYLEPKNTQLPLDIINDIFKYDYGKTLNLNTLQARIKELKNWYIDNGFSLARISGPNRVTKDGKVELKVLQGKVDSIDIKFLNKEGESTDDNGKLINGKTQDYTIRREISLKSNDPFNRKQLEADIKRLYGTNLFSDVKVTLKPVAGKPGFVKIILGITEQSTGSLTGGLGYSQSQGVFGQIGVQESNLFGKAWNAGLDLTYGEYGGLVNFSFVDPWIKGDKYRTSFRTSIFISRESPQEFRSQSGGSFRTASAFYDAPGRVYANDVGADKKYSTVAQAKASESSKSWFDYEGNSVALERTGMSFNLSRPLNGGDPYKKVPWSVLVGMNFQRVKAIDYAGNDRPYGVLTKNLHNSTVPDNEIICVAFNCAVTNNLLGIRTATTYNTLNDARNPTSGDFISVGTEQFFSVGDDSPTFNRARASYTHFLPVNWIKISKGCRPKGGEKRNCPQAIGLQMKAGAIVGQLPPYEAFCVGGSSSVRGWSSCELAVGRNFGEASVEYRFPIWGIVAGAFFVDVGTDFGSQDDVPGKPGKLLDKPGSGYSPGAGVVVNTPVGPIRLEAANQEFSGETRFNLGVGWKF
tara:strand:- start:8842 stop:11073 length:2232 start_codon:yes stop_codon:yes gene_type:complete